MGKVRICIFCAVFLTLFLSLGFSETILLKSGQKVEGRIIENTDKYVKLDFFGVELTYYKDEIASIVRGVQNSENSVNPQLKSLYQAYTSSLNIPQKQKEEKITEVSVPAAPQAAEMNQVVSTLAPNISPSQLPPEYQKMIQSVMQASQSSQPGVSKPMAGMPLGMDISKLPPEYQKMIKSAMVNMQAAKAGASGEKE